MNPLPPIVITAEIGLLFLLCLSISFGIAYVFLRTTVMLTTQQRGSGSAGLRSRRLLSAGLLRARRPEGR
ncbi:MAG: hypothetical protein ABJF23_03820 [Bryobacteraceae bacterium]